MTQPYDSTRLIDKFVRRLDKIGITVKLSANYPWIYLDEVNGEFVTEKYRSEHGFTAFFYVNSVKFSDRREVFKLIRTYKR
jgi:hypothetical protein